MQILKEDFRGQKTVTSFFTFLKCTTQRWGGGGGAMKRWEMKGAVREHCSDNKLLNLSLFSFKKSHFLNIELFKNGKIKQN